MFRQMRRFKQQISEDECIRILKEQPRGVLSVIGDNGYPYGIPLDHLYSEDDQRLYFHCAKEGHKLDAIKTCEKAFKVDSDNATIKETAVKAYEAMAEACRAKGDYKEERKYYGEILKYNPSRTDLHEKIAVSFENQGKMQDAAEYRAKHPTNGQ